VCSGSAAVHAAARAAGFKLLGSRGDAPAGTELLLETDGTLSHADGARAGRRLRISDAFDAAAALELAGTEELLLVEPAAGCWAIIPAENAIAAFASHATKLFFCAQSAAEAEVLFGALEVGVDGCVLTTEDAAEVEALCAHLQRSLAPRMQLLPARVTRVQPVGMGDRACVDTAAALLPSEGLLVGSFAGGFFLVCSEALASSYINPRPFRVNAGAVSSYTLQGDRTAYLTELAAGATVLLTDALGNVRHEVVCRIKIERRPMLLVEAEADAQRFSVLLQNAETVRLATPSGSVAVTELRPGDAVLLALAPPARHGGVAVEEACTER
jgi:3-dehydroquinate synthase II